MTLDENSIRGGEPMSTVGSPKTRTGEDVVDVLTTDHREVTDLIAQIGSTTDPGQRRDLADIMISELVRHAVAEEMFVYPAMKKHLADGEQAVEHDIAEHKELEQTMKELEGVEPTEARFDALISQLSTVLADHVQDEETEQFPQLRAAIPPEELVELADKVQAAKKVAPTRPHPSAPNDQLFHKLAGPGVGMVEAEGPSGRPRHGLIRTGRDGPDERGRAHCPIDHYRHGEITAMSELTGPSPEVPSDESTAELLDLNDAAAVLGVQPDRLAAMVEEGMLHPVDSSQAEPQFRLEEVHAVADLGG